MALLDNGLKGTVPSILVILGVALVAKSAVSGVMEAAGQIGGNVGVAAKAAVGGALEAAGTLSQSAITAVRDVLVSAVEGVKDVASAILPKGDTTPPVSGGGQARGGCRKKAGARQRGGELRIVNRD